MFKLLSVVFSIAVFANSHVEAIKCYACSMTAGDVDQRCATDPSAVESKQNIINCNKQYCTSIRMEFKDPPGKVASFYRGCEDNPAQMNTVQEDDTHVVYYKACTKDLCNGGNGKGTEGEGTIEGDTGGSGSLRVPGTSYAVQMSTSIRTIASLLTVSMFCKIYIYSRDI